MTDQPDRPAKPTLERKLATILSADVAEFSRLMAEDEEQTLHAFRAHREVFESLVGLHRGRIFNTAGDAILAEFGSAVEAVRCATEIQAALRTVNDQVPVERQVRFRIGVNLGDVMVQGADLLGDGVNVAARLQSAAEPGGICVSGSVYDQILNKLSLSFKSLGDMSYKNIPQPVRTFSITGAEQGTLPSPRPLRQRGRVTARHWFAAAVVILLVLIGGGYWTYAQIQQGKAEQARLVAEATAAKQEAAQQKEAAEAAQRRADAERQTADAAQRDAQAAAERAAADAEREKLQAQTRAAEVARQQAEAETRRLVDADRKKAEAAAQIAAATPRPAPAAPAAPTAPATASTSLDGTYAGPICYGPANNEPARCFRAQATLSQGKFSGQWQGRGNDTTVMLSGQVSASGDVKIHMHSENTDRGFFGIVDMTGTLRDGKIDAAGAFRNGRTATLNWRKS